jgi:hypothetical protein
MDMNEYLIEKMVGERISEMHAAALRWHLPAMWPPRRPLRVRLGLALIRLGHLALGAAHRPLAPRTS